MFYNDDIKLLFFFLFLWKGNDSPSAALTVFRYCLPRHLLVWFTLLTVAIAYLRSYVMFTPLEIRIIVPVLLFDLLSCIFDLLPSYITLQDIDIENKYFVLFVIFFLQTYDFLQTPTYVILYLLFSNWFNTIFCKELSIK